MLNYQRVYSWQVHQSFSSYVFSQFTIRQLNAIAHTFPRSVSWSRNSTQSSKRKDHQDHLASVYLMVLYEFTVYIYIYMYVCVCIMYVYIYICIHIYIYIHTVYCVYIRYMYTCTWFCIPVLRFYRYRILHTSVQFARKPPLISRTVVVKSSFSRTDAACKACCLGRGRERNG